MKDKSYLLSAPSHVPNNAKNDENVLKELLLLRQKRTNLNTYLKVVSWDLAIDKKDLYSMEREIYLTYLINDIEKHMDTLATNYYEKYFKSILKEKK